MTRIIVMIRLVGRGGLEPPTSALVTVECCANESGRGEPGYAVFTTSEDKRHDEIEQLERELGGPVPLSIATWWRIVGSVDFTRRPGSGPPVEYPDPLVVLPPSAVLNDLAEWKEDQEYRKARHTYMAPLAPDSFHKEDVSGGAPYAIALPNPACDVELLNMERSFTFVAYLRHAFSWAGLPRYGEVFSKPPPEIVAIAAQLEPLRVEGHCHGRKGDSIIPTFRHPAT